MTDEIWIGFETGYEVSNLGNVRSIDRIVTTVKNQLIADMFGCSISSIKRLNKGYAIQAN